MVAWDSFQEENGGKVSPREHDCFQFEKELGLLVENHLGSRDARMITEGDGVGCWVSAILFLVY